MCVTNNDCPQGFNCNSESGQCVPKPVIKDPIKPEPVSVVKSEED